MPLTTKSHERLCLLVPAARDYKSSAQSMYCQFEQDWGGGHFIPLVAQKSIRWLM